MSHQHHSNHGHEMNDHSMMSNHGGNPPMQHGMAMTMYFHFGFESFVLFQQWTAETVTSLLLTCLFFFVLAILYEVLKAYRRVAALRYQLTQTERIVNHSASIASAAAENSLVTGLTADTSRPIPLIVGSGESAGSSISDHSGNGHQNLVPKSGSNAVYIMDANALTSENDLTMPAIGTDRKCHPSYGVHGNVQGPSSVRIATAPIPIFSTVNEMFSWENVSSTMLYMLQVVFAYLLMLAFMLFNVWICIAIIMGAAFGHFLLSHKAIAYQDSANEDYCH